MICALIPLALCAALGGEPEKLAAASPASAVTVAPVALPSEHRRHLECHARKPGRTNWQWRLVDGRRCYYTGRRVAKSALSWRRMPVSRILGIGSRPVVERAGASADDHAPTQRNDIGPARVRTIVVPPSFDDMWNMRIGR